MRVHKEKECPCASENREQLKAPLFVEKTLFGLGVRRWERWLVLHE
jgi:hypothetical protein